MLESLSRRPHLGFDLTIVGNANDYSQQITVRTRKRATDDWQEAATTMAWPRGVYSLSHVALPFPADDPIYGETGVNESTRLGDLWFRGEQGGLAIPLPLLARQRFNPFFPYLENKLLEAVRLVTPPD
jgi:hypothetical protein